MKWIKDKLPTPLDPVIVRQEDRHGPYVRSAYVAGEKWRRMNGHELEGTVLGWMSTRDAVKILDAATEAPETPSRYTVTQLFAGLPHGLTAMVERCQSDAMLRHILSQAIPEGEVQVDGAEYLVKDHTGGLLITITDNQPEAR